MAAKHNRIRYVPYTTSTATPPAIHPPRTTHHFHSNTTSNTPTTISFQPPYTPPSSHHSYNTSWRAWQTSPARWHSMRCKPSSSKGFIPIGPPRSWKTLVVRVRVWETKQHLTRKTTFDRKQKKSDVGPTSDYFRRIKCCPQLWNLIFSTLDSIE